MVAEQQKKTIKIKKDTEKMKAISDAEREKEVRRCVIFYCILDVFYVISKLTVTISGFIILRDEKGL